MPLKQQRELIFTKLGYYPSAVQSAVHDADARVKLVAGGERSGKSYSSAMELVSKFFEGKLFWLVAADYERTRAEYTYICDALDKLGLSYHATKQVDPGEINIVGGFRIATKSGKDPRKIAMEAPDGILVCEASQIDYDTFLRLRGRIAEKRGWMLMSGTFESSLGWYPELYTRWQAANVEGGKSFSLPTWSNLAVYPGGRQDDEILALESASSTEWFLERYAGVPCPPRGRVFEEFSNQIHTGVGGNYEFNPSELVYIAVDPGYASAYAVLACQKNGEHLYVIDEIYEKGLITSDIIKVAKQRPWWNKVIGGAIDIAATQHQAMAAPTEVWLKEAGVIFRSQKIQIRDGIERTKTFLIVNPVTNQPLLHINSRCLGLISELGGCPSPVTKQTAVYSWKKDREGNIVGEVPEDKHNHAVKALAYWLVDSFGYSAAQRPAKIKFF